MKTFIAFLIASLAVTVQGSYLPAATTTVVAASPTSAWPYSTAWNSWNGWNKWNDYQPHYQQHGLVAYPSYAQDWSPAYGVYGGGHKTEVQANLGGHAASYPWGLPWGSFGAGYAGNFGWGKKVVY
ncbi:uncharacterized protein LOC115265804 [Aedes albopictus]|uniref:Secreted protein n=1 Tax=Aedes albopictus TaxID=7160 RepID=A0ABM1XT42_AEDAL|nr:uncharacterized protein LOC115265804 [Aedes albopictus]